MKTTNDLLQNAQKLSSELVYLLGKMAYRNVIVELKDLRKQAADGLFYSRKALETGGHEGVAYEELCEATALYSHLESGTYSLFYMMKESGYNGSDDL